MTEPRIEVGDALHLPFGDGEVAAVITDPPYGLEFMNAKWDAPWESDPHVGQRMHDGWSNVEMADGAQRLRRPTFEKRSNVRCRTCDRWRVSSNPCTCEEPDFPNLRQANMRAFQAWCEQWAREVYRVLPPGGYLLAFGGTRTFHRLASGIEDAGFEVRDTLMWLYGCLDEATEALTRTGWKSYRDLSTADEVLQWDHATGALTWTRPAEVIVRPYAGPMVRLRNRHADQMLTPNHRVYARIQRHSRGPAPDAFEVVEAGDLRAHWITDLPMAGHLDDGCPVDPDRAYLVGWWLTDAWTHADGKAAMFSQCKPETLARLRAALAPYGPSEYVKQPRDPQHQPEHTFYVVGELADYLRAHFPDRRLDASVLSWSRAARLRLFDGLIDGDGSRPAGQHGVAFWSRDPERRGLVVALALGLGWRAYEDAGRGAVYVNRARAGTQLQHRHRTAAPPEHYEGDVWCVRVPTGAFVVRRNGRPFITGNSGFPKSLDVSKAIDAHLGAERPIMGARGGGSASSAGGVLNMNGRDAVNGSGRESREIPIDEPATAAARQWQGWGTALKPAWEPIVVARKPLAGTVAETVLAHGTGALNVEAARIAGTKPVVTAIDSDRRSHQTLHTRSGTGTGETTTEGRWPANVILSHLEDCERLGTREVRSDGHYPGARAGGSGTVYGGERFHGQDGLAERHMAGETVETWACGEGCPVALLDAQSGVTTGAGPRAIHRATPRVNTVYGADERPPGFAGTTFGDSGGASRFFYTAKADYGERERGLRGHLPCTGCGDLNSREHETEEGRTVRCRRNPHPTVKPVSVMRWLVELVAPPGGLILDPFMGSGTTGVAAVELGVPFAGLDLSPQYVEVARRRILADRPMRMML